MGKKSKISRISICQKKKISRKHYSFADDLHNFLKKEDPMYEKFCNSNEYSMLEDLANLIVDHYNSGKSLQFKNKNIGFHDLDNCSKVKFRNELVNIVSENDKSTPENTGEVEDKISGWASQLLNGTCSNQASPSSKPCSLKIAHDEIFIFHDDSDSDEESDASSTNNIINPINTKISKIKLVPEKSSKINNISSNFANSLSFCIANIYSLRTDLRSVRKIISGVGWKIYVTTHIHKIHSDYDKSLSFYVQCCPNSYDDRWNVKANCELSIYSHAHKCWKIGYQFSHVFNSTYDDCGLVHFIKWKDLIDSDEKYVLDGKVYLEAIIDVKGPIKVTSFGQYHSRLKMYSSIFDIQMTKGNKREAEEVCDLALKYCMKTDREAIKHFEEKHSLLVRDKVVDTITRLQQENLQNNDKGIVLKNKANLKNFCLGGSCKKNESTCNQADVKMKDILLCINDKIKKKEVVYDNLEVEKCESNKNEAGTDNTVRRKLIPQHCENQYFMRTLFFERKNYMFPCTVYNKKKLFTLPDNYIIDIDKNGENITKKSNIKFINENSLEKNSISKKNDEKTVSKIESIGCLTEVDKKILEDYPIEHLYHDKIDYFNFIAKRASIISRYVDKLSKNISDEARKLLLQFYENNSLVNKNKLLTTIKDDALGLYLRMVPFWLMEDDGNINNQPIFLDFNKEYIFSTIEAIFYSMNILKSVSNNKIKDEKISLYCNNKKKFIESLNSVCVIPQSLIETMKEMLTLWIQEYKQFSLTMNKNQKKLIDDNLSINKKYDDLYKNFNETKEMLNTLSKSYSVQTKNISMFNEIKKKCDEYKKENEMLIRNNQSIIDSKKNMAKELANLREQNKLLSSQIQEKDAALKKFKKVAEQEKIALSKENETLRTRCIRSELMYLEKSFSIGIKELYKAKDEALEYINDMKNLLDNINEKYVNIVCEKIKEFENYICEIDEKIEIATNNHIIHSTSIEKGKSLSQIGKIKIRKPKALPEKLNTNMFTKLDVVWCDNLSLQNLSIENEKYNNNKEKKKKYYGSNRKRLSSSPTSDAFSCSSGESHKVKDVFTDCGYYITSISPISDVNTLSTFEINNFIMNKDVNKIKFNTEYQNTNFYTFSPSNSSSSFETLKYSNTSNIFENNDASNINHDLLQNFDYINSIDNTLVQKNDKMLQLYDESSIMMATQNIKPLSEDRSNDLNNYTYDIDSIPSDDYQILYKAFCSSNSQKSDW
ncbi:MATH domain and TRAF-like domain-containing protein [Strongyloides ratti]|uniref:MATH domain and TRAF-like domain-containing protein n=1 Tax=Strongyloides ratti TaxID=34506 RepID=A0A090L942_STRRB|nr:MATH domain and TRAF-like domain-containing protein [Strongyloides ratti]CEF66247.1 MATH domain and TRAF-like domain-containing protein [Strongyloides ratti]